MSSLPHLQEIFDRLRRGRHLSREDEPEFSSLMSSYDDYAAYFAPLGLKLVRHPRDFFYFAPDAGDPLPEGLPRIAVFSYIFVDHASNLGRSLEEFFFGQHFVVSRLPHFSLDRYSALLRQVEVKDAAGLRKILQAMERLCWVKFVAADEFRFLKPFHRMLDKCLDVYESQANSANGTADEG